MHRDELETDWARAKGGGTPEPIDPLPSDEAMDFVRVTSAQALGHYRLRVGFTDDSSRDVDLTGKLHDPQRVVSGPYATKIKPSGTD